jgi:hypothetical protein
MFTLFSETEESFKIVSSTSLGAVLTTLWSESIVITPKLSAKEIISGLIAVKV